MQVFWDKIKENALLLALAAAVVVLFFMWFATKPAKAEGVGKSGLVPIGDVAAATAPWTGFYVGAGGGYQVGDTRLDLNCGECGDTEPHTLLRANGVSGRGWAIDVRAGLDWQVPNTVFVVGVLGGYNWGSVGENSHDPDFETTIAGTLEQTWYAGGRTGVALPSKTLVYVGYAWTQADASVSRGSGGAVLASASKTIDGQMFLAGIEQVIAPNFTLGVEYTLSQFDDTCFDLAGRALNIEPEVHAFKARLNWRPFAK